ncbi:AfsR/SARP family transcriptional regulator [Streptomyces humi]|uniref:AfsR/SARP family transcriptional regulator n=1 Tax=Streptomyces humi TaxID=1428620 RepID=UPI00069AC307|nr:BTAD domain-containing putative transcriptional regulator [Streptomyces humi]
MAWSELTGEAPRTHPAAREREVTRLCLFGAFRLEGANGTIAVPANEQRLLAYLGLHKRASRSVVAGTLWPEVTEEHAHGSLRTALWRLRRGRRPTVCADGDHLYLSDAVRVDVDDLARAALRLTGSAPDPTDPALPPALLEGGELLPGWDAEWIFFERERLRQLRLHALEALSARLTRRGCYALALEAALRCVAIEPLRESAHCALVAVHLAEHNVAEALRHYEAFRRLLSEELGLEPSARFTGMFPNRTVPYPSST